MDIVRPPQKKTARNVGIGLGVVALVLASWGLSRMKPAAPTVELLQLLTDTVRRGDVTRDVRGPGNLVAERILFITPQVNGRVENVIALSGATLKAGDIILTMSSPDQQIATTRAQQQVRQAQLDLANLKNSLQTQKSQQELTLASAKTSRITTEQQVKEADSLVKIRPNLLSSFDVAARRAAAEEAVTRYNVAEAQLKMTVQATDSQLAVAAANVEALKAIAANEESRLKSLIITAPEAGQLQQDQVLQPGQWVVSGQTVAKVVQPTKLKAVLRIPESQAKDVAIGQQASIDTRVGIIPGHVSRKDASAQGGSITVDVSLDGALPPGAVPDLSIDGTIQIEHLKDVIYTGRPVSGAATGPVGMFKFVEGGKYAVRTTVQLGQNSVNTVVILNGLQPGDKVILSDMSQYDNVDRVRVK